MQNRRGLIFIAMALVLGLAAALLAQRWSASKQPQVVASLDTTPVLVARADVSVASQLQPVQLNMVDWPTEHVPAGAMGSAADAEGRVTRRPILAGEPILEGALFPDGAEGGLVAVISPEHRAISVKVDSVIGVAGFIKPGSRVDVLATLRRVDKEKPIPYSRVILQDVQVLAIDQKLEDRDGQAEPVNVVTLEVDTVQAEHLIYAAHEGRLQLALRTPGDDLKVDTESVSVADLLEDGKPNKSRTRMARQSGPTVEVIRGSQLEVQTF
jgi:pilus assembly protein CpaB